MYLTSITSYLNPYQLVTTDRASIGGQPVRMLANTLSIDDAIGERSTASFTVVTDFGTRFYKGQPVEIYDKQTLLFRGVVDKSTEERPPGTAILYHNVSCVDWHYLADKRVIAKAYEMTAAGDIISDIITSILADEGVSAGDILPGPIVNEAVFNYVKVTEAIDAVAEKAGYVWYIDFDKRLHFRPRAEIVAPWTVTPNDIRTDVRVEHGNPMYRNTQYIKGGTDITDPQTQEFRGDGVTTTFVTGFKIAKVPTIALNGVPQTVGIRGLEEGRDWYWSKGENVISQDEDATPISENDVLSVTYQGEFPIVVISRDHAEITALSARESNSGIVEDVGDEPQTSNREAAFQSANAKLAKYGVIGRRIQFRTMRTGLAAGQLVTVDYPEHDLQSAEMLIESVTITDEDNVIWYDVSAVEGPEQGSWTRMFQAMATRGQAFIIRENISEDEILVTLAPFEKYWSAPENPNIFRQVYAAPDLFPSSDLYPPFGDGDRVKYLSWYNGSTEIGRKVITKQETEDGYIESTTFLAPTDANGAITHIGWWGGINATEANGSGVLVDRQPYAKEKTELEAIQVEKRDYRDFTPATGNLLITAQFMSDLYDRATELVAKSV